MIPIPFLGWVMDDEEDTQQMLRDQLQIQQHRIRELEGQVMMLQEECCSLIKQIGEIQ
jgi:hypothetical protein